MAEKIAALPYDVYNRKDAGYAAVGNQIELFAKLSILVLSIPVLTVFLETVGSFL